MPLTSAHSLLWEELKNITGYADTGTVMLIDSTIEFFVEDVPSVVNP
jgi:hypothetical protein